MTDPTIQKKAQRLAMHMATTSELLTMGIPAAVLQQQLINVRAAVADMLAAEIPSGDIVQVTRHMSARVADALAGHVEVPDDCSGLDDE